MNTGPVIENFDEPFVTFTMTSPDVIITVIASDPDGDELDFTWTGLSTHPHTVEPKRQAGNKWVSTIMFERDDTLDGEIVRINVVDQVSGNQAFRFFTLELP